MFSSLDDILRSRVKTISPTETILPNLEPGLEWRMCRSHSFGYVSYSRLISSTRADDVGGARRQRAKWAPFFDDSTHIASALTFPLLADLVLSGPDHRLGSCLGV